MTLSVVEFSLIVPRPACTYTTRIVVVPRYYRYSRPLVGFVFIHVQPVFPTSFLPPIVNVTPNLADLPARVYCVARFFPRGSLNFFPSQTERSLLGFFATPPDFLSPPRLDNITRVFNLTEDRTGPPVAE